MPIIVNGHLIPEAWIGEEEQRVACDLRLKSIADDQERSRQVAIAAQQSAIDRMLVEQAAANDPRPIDADAVEQEVERQKQAGNCRPAFDDSLLRRLIDGQMRIQRTYQEMIDSAVKPAAEEIAAFYETHRENFHSEGVFHAAHIVKHVERDGDDEKARGGIEAALAELERGEPFAEVAERHSDCKGKGGDLGQFPAGQMVQEFEDALRVLKRTAYRHFPQSLRFPYCRAACQGFAWPSHVRRSSRRHRARPYDAEPAPGLYAGGG